MTLITTALLGADYFLFRMNVIASAGTSEKVEYMRSLGADVPFNYKTESITSVLAQHGPIDVYWDNVGGGTLETAIQYVGFHGRIIVCKLE